MKKTLLLLFALLTMGGVNSYAGKTYWSPAGQVASWDNETNTMSWNGTDYYKVMKTNLPANELSVDTKIHVTVSNITGENDYIRLKIVSIGKPELWINLVAGENVIGFEEYTNSINWDDVTEITLWGTGSQNGSAVVTDFYMYKPTTLTFNNGVATIDASEIMAYNGLSITSDGVVTSDGSGVGYLEVTFANPVDLSDMKTLSVSRSGNENLINWTNLIKSDGTYVHNTSSWYSSKFGLSFNADQAARATDVKKIKMEAIAKNDGESDADYAVRVAGLSLTITGITITASSMSMTDAHDVAIASLPHYSVAADGTAALTSAIATNYGEEAVETPLGDGSSNMDEYIDIADYDELRVYTEGNARVFLINEAITSGTSSKAGATVKLDNSETGQKVTFTHNTAEGYYSAKISDIVTGYGQAKVIGVKAASWGAKVSVSKIQVYKENPASDFILSGHYSSTYDLSALASSTTATLVDATGLKGSNVTLTSGNPNCIFLASAGVLANTKNVCVDGTIANLDLTDGYPMQVPEGGATATAATYSRNMASGIQFGTICLPYPTSSTDEVKFYTIADLSGETITLQKEATLAAGTPAIVWRSVTDAATITVTGSGDLADVVAASSDLQLRGTFEQQTINASDYSNGIYGIYNNEFWEAETSITLPPFRAFFTTETGAAGTGSSTAKYRLVIADEEETAIKNLTGKGATKVVGIYSLNGVRQQSLQKGMNVVKFSDGKSQKVLVK